MSTGPSHSEELAEIVNLLHQTVTPPVNSIDLVTAARTLRASLEWERIELYLGSIDVSLRERFPDSSTGQQVNWEGLTLTSQAFNAITHMNRIFARYQLEHVSVALLAFAAFAEPGDSGAAKFLRSSDDSPETMIALASEILLDTRLEGISSSEIPPRQPTSEEFAGKAISGLLTVAKLNTSADRDQDVVSSALLVLASIQLDRAPWLDCAAYAGFDLKNYEVNLQWASRRHVGRHEPPNEIEDTTAQNVQKFGSPMTALCATTITRFLSWTTMHPSQLLSLEQARLLIAASLLMRSDASAATGISDHHRSRLRAELIARVSPSSDLSTLFEAHLSAVESDGEDAQSLPKEREPSKPSKLEHVSRKGQTTGLIVGGLLGAILVSGIAGLPLATCITLASLSVSGIVSIRRGQERSVRKPLAVLCLLAVLLGLGLAVTGSAPVRNDLRAAHLLSQIHGDVERGRLRAAIPLVGEANLIADKSVSSLITGACIDWRLHFHDYALFEVAEALFNGWDPDESSHFDNNNCFLDVPTEHALRYLYLPKLGFNLVFVQPSDKVTDTWDSLAESQSETKPEYSIIAAACILDHYNLRALASYYFTVGINSAYRLGDGKLPFASLLACIRQPSLNKNYFVSHPSSGSQYDLFQTRDFIMRVPTPTHPTPPAGACWAELPLDETCAEK